MSEKKSRIILRTVWFVVVIQTLTVSLVPDLSGRPLGSTGMDPRQVREQAHGQGHLAKDAQARDLQRLVHAHAPREGGGLPGSRRPPSPDMREATRSPDTHDSCPEGQPAWGLWLRPGWETDLAPGHWVQANQSVSLAPTANGDARWRANEGAGRGSKKVTSCLQGTQEGKADLLTLGWGWGW